MTSLIPDLSAAAAAARRLRDRTTGPEAHAAALEAEALERADQQTARDGLAALRDIFGGGR